MDEIVQAGEAEVLADLEDFPIDDGILAKFPPGTQLPRSLPPTDMDYRNGQPQLDFV